MSTLSVATIKSQNTLPPAVQNSSGTQIGTFCRAWVNFNGTGTVAIRASFNVSSITDNGTGDYTVNFTTAMPDADYSSSFSAQRGNVAAFMAICGPYGTADNSIVQTASTLRLTARDFGGVVVDVPLVAVAIFR
jgi:hypothetical protein